MRENYFIYKGEKYVIIYDKGKMNIFKSKDNRLSLLSETELKRINELLNRKYSYIYDSERLSNIVALNPNIENPNYVMSYLNWLEDLIPEEYRDNFYRNVETLKTYLNAGLVYTFSENEDSEKKEGSSAAGGYSVKENTVAINSKALRNLWELSKKIDENPERYYWKEYSLYVLHELSHMASSRYDKENDITYCGFDKMPSDNEEEKNRGLTEGYTDAIAMAGVPNTIEIASGYYIESSLVNQMIQIVGNEEFSRSYFCNLGISNIKAQFDELINNPNMSSDLFRLIELNYNIGDLDIKQSALGNIQLMLLDYLDKRLEILASQENSEEISTICTIYEDMLITPEKLKARLRNPEKFIGVEDSIKKFEDLKVKYKKYLEEDDIKR